MLGTRFANVDLTVNELRMRKGSILSMIENLEDRALDCSDVKEIESINVVVSLLRTDLKKLDGGD